VLVVWEFQEESENQVQDTKLWLLMGYFLLMLKFGMEEHHIQLQEKPQEEELENGVLGLLKVVNTVDGGICTKTSVILLKKT